MEMEHTYTEYWKIFELSGLCGIKWIGFYEETLHPGILRDSLIRLYPPSMIYTHKAIILFIECASRGDLRQLNSADQSVWAESRTRTGTIYMYLPDCLPTQTDQLCSIGAKSSSIPPLSRSTLLYVYNITTGTTGITCTGWGCGGLFGDVVAYW